MPSAPATSGKCGHLLACLANWLRQVFQEIGVISIAALLLLVGGTLGWVAYDEYRQTQEAEYRLLEAHARNAEAQVAGALARIDRLLQLIAEEQLKTQSLHSQAYSRVLDHYRDDLPELGTLLVSDAAGRIRGATDKALIGRDVILEPFFSAHLDRGQRPKLFMSRPDKRLLGVTAIVFSLPIVSAEREFLGIVGITIDFRFFPRVLRSINSDDSASMSVIFNRDGDLLFRRSEPEKFFGNNIAKASQVLRQHFQAGTQTTRHLGPSAIDGKARLFVVREVGDSGLGLILSRQFSEVLARWQRNVMIYLVIFVFTAVLLIFLDIVASRRKRQVLAAKQQAEEANAAKSKFLAAASHDLRQPIHAQGLFIELLGRTPLTAEQQEVLTAIRAAAEASAEMLNTLLDFSRIEAGVIVPQVQAFALQPLLNKLENELAPQADAKNIIYRSRETQLTVRSDPALVELILRNLVANAIRYTERGGVLVACRRRGAEVAVEIWDTGIGIAPAERHAVFREFHQLGNPERDRRKGFGLGLAICQGLAHTLGHDLSLHSTPGRGSLFRLCLPLAASALPSALSAPAAGGGQQLRNKHILVIDDDEAVRIGTLELLRDWGCAGAAAESIAEALVLAERRRPDLVISDYRLRQQHTGAQAIAALRTVYGEQLPALLITGDTAPERLAEAQASGIPLLHKPVSPSQLHRALVAALSAGESATRQAPRPASVRQALTSPDYSA